MLQWIVFGCAYMVAGLVIANELDRKREHILQIMRALFSRPQSRWCDRSSRWRLVHRAADRRPPFITSDTRAAAPVEQGKRA